MDTGFYKTYFEIEKNHWLMRVRRGIVRDSLKLFYKKNNLSHLKILDYGCGSGFLVGEFQNMGIKAVGVDMSDGAISYGISRGIKNLFVIKDKMNFPSNIYDSILLMDVLEHIKDVKPVLQDIVSVLKPDGSLVVTVPAYMFMWGVQDDIAHHYRRYTIKNLIKEFESFPELSVIRSTYFNTFLFFPIVCVRLLSKMFRIRGRESDFDINNGILDSVFYWVFNLERKILKYISFPFGVSIVLVLKKNG